jgi:hypothetical protein
MKEDEVNQHTAAPMPQRFWGRVDRSGDCWEWRGNFMWQGYGVFWIDGQNRMAHRVSWSLAFCPIPRGQMVLHHCDNTSCVNPAHLFLGTQADNMTDKVTKGRQASGERAGTARLTRETVAAIRRAADAGETGKALARRFGVGNSQACRIIRGESWKGVA